MHHRYPHTIAGLLLLAWSCHALAQPVNPRYSFSQLNIQNGLADNIVYHFLQDSRGCMWMGTRN
jgi:ligand-binding sensor domain-containing protein